MGAYSGHNHIKPRRVYACITLSLDERAVTKQKYSWQATLVPDHFSQQKLFGVRVREYVRLIDCYAQRSGTNEWAI